MAQTKYTDGSGVSEMWLNIKNWVTSQLLGYSQTGHTHTKSEITDFPSLATVATSGSYNDLSNKPTIPTVNNATLTIQKNGTNVKTFTANASSNVTCNITVPTNTNQLTNGAGYITSSGSCNYANSSGNADTLDGYHHDSFPKTSEALFTVNGLGSPGWSAIGTGTGGSCIQVKTTDNTYPSICFHRSGYSHCVLAEYNGQLGTMQQGSETFNPLITSANIGSQNVNYANSAGSAGSVAWNNVSGRPTKVSQFTNDSGFLTSADRLPIGSYIQFAGSQAPAGFLVCNGGAVSRTTYSKLFAVIGTTYGSGDGSTTFNLPNLTDRFLQGSTTSGTVKDAGLPNITGSARIAEHSLTTFAIEEPQGCFVGQNCGWTNDNMVITSGMQNVLNRQLGMNASLSNPIYGKSSTVQPPALTCLICIKY